MIDGNNKDIAYKKLLDEIKKVNSEDKKYKPKKYSFGLDSFDEEGNKKK